MDIEEIALLKTKLGTAANLLRKSEERSTAGQLALEVMHEIRNPLEALGHLIYLACNNIEDPTKIQEYLSRAEEQLATLNQIASQSLGFARSQPSPQPTDLVGLAEAALRIHQRTIQQNRVHLVKELPERLEARVYAGEILQVISNVIVNALDALPPDGVLHLRLRLRGEKIQFILADNGHGIPPEHLPNIFEPFFTTKGERGTGLGLSLSRNIVESHGGKMRVRSSVRPGKSGAIFKISLPARAA